MHTLGRIMSCSMTSELDDICRNHCNRNTRKTLYISPLRSIHRRSEGVQPAEDYPMEMIPPFVTPPWWLGPTIHIEEEAFARSTHDREITKGNICIYTDGGSIGGHVGAAAVYLDTGQMRKTYMGTDATSTVYAAELQGINLALAMARAEVETGPCQKVINIFADNQAAIRSLTRPEGRSGAYILKQIAARVEPLQKSRHTMVVRWIPSHQGIEGNEAADIAAKEATGWREGVATGSRAELPPETG